MYKPRITTADISIAIILWALLILRYGFTFGTNDHIELLPYVMFLKNPSLYPHDLFIQSLHASLPNERTVMAHLLLPFANHLFTIIFLLHFLNTVLLLLALEMLAKRFISNKYFAWLAVFISVWVLNDKGLGNVDLYTPAIQASDVSCMIIAWALNVFWDEKYLFASLLMCAATYIHVLEGFDVMAVLCGVMLLSYWVYKSVSLRQVIMFIGLHAIIALPYLALIYRAKTLHTGPLSSAEIFQIMFLFRHPHHFIFSTFPLINKILFIVCIIAGLLYYKARSQGIFLFIVVAGLGILFYIIGVDVLHSVTIANFQWYKVVQWTKFLGVVAFVGFIFNYVSGYISEKNKILDFTILPFGLAVLCFMFYQYKIGTFNIGYKQLNENEIALCQKIKMLVPNNAVFIQPFEMTALKFYGQRSSYVEFKAIAKNQKDLQTWYDRIGEIYALDYKTDKNGFNMQWKANDNLNKLDETKLAKLQAEGVTHIICSTNKYKLQHKLILSENGYFVYKL